MQIHKTNLNAYIKEITFKTLMIYFSLLSVSTNTNISNTIYKVKNITFFKSNPKKISLSFLFLLNLFLKNHPNVISDIISFAFIKDFFTQINNDYFNKSSSNNNTRFMANNNSNNINVEKNENNEMDYYYRLIFRYITLIKLINFYKQNTKEYKEDKEKQKQVAEIESEIFDKFDRNNGILIVDFNIEYVSDDIISKDFTQIYMELITSLIKSKKFINYQSTYPKIKKLGLENIEIAEICPNEIRELLDPEKKYIKEYIIKEKKDLLDKEKICFYFFLLKYIVKNYLYNIPFLLETRKLIIKLLKTNELFFNEQNEIKNKREYIIKQLLNSEYYFRPIPDEDINKLKAVLNYYKELFYESKQDDIINHTSFIGDKN